MGRRRKTTQEFIEDAKEVHGDKYDYSNVVYKKAKIKIEINCPEHGKFKQRPNSHLNNNNGCPNCADNNKKKTTEEFIEDAKKVHGNKYDYSKVDYNGSNKKLTIICPEHGEFKQKANNHINKENGCYQCYLDNKSLTNEDFFNRIKKRDDKGNIYDYSKVNYKGIHTNVTIICPEHGEFEQMPQNHFTGQGCPKCHGRGFNTKHWIKKFKLEHGDKYDYSKVTFNRQDEKVIIICPKHGEFEQTAYAHKKGRGCQACGNEKVGNKNNKRAKNNFIKKSKEIHNDKYDYSKVEYTYSNKKVTIICPKHGEFKQTPNGHLYGRGCKKCGKYKAGWSYSKWVNSANNSNNFDSFKLYIIKLNNKKLNKKFYKIGRTYNKIEDRFNSTALPYDYEIIHVKISDSGKKICKLEEKYKRLCEKYSYIPNKDFGGMYECFTSIDPILKFLN